MIFTFTFTQESPMYLKTFLKQKGFSRRLIAKIKYDGGQLRVNDTLATVNYLLHTNDRIVVVTPDEKGLDNVVPVDEAIAILYEDDHYLIVNKPAFTASIPSYLHPKYSMANRVKGYYVAKGYANQVIHVVTRLDRDTTGVMLFAKHKLAHALMDEQLRQGAVDKRYIAFASNVTNTLTNNTDESCGEYAPNIKNSNTLQKEGYIEAPIERDPNSIVTRQVAIDEAGQFKSSGKYALTQYWETDCLIYGKSYCIKLHTGRTHQIRVHFNYMNCPLIGDSLYNGRMDTPLQRQALHCYQLTFYHAFEEKMVCITAPLPEDMAQLLNK